GQNIGPLTARWGRCWRGGREGRGTVGGGSGGGGRRRAGRGGPATERGASAAPARRGGGGGGGSGAGGQRGGGGGAGYAAPAPPASAQRRRRCVVSADRPRKRRPTHDCPGALAPSIHSTCAPTSMVCAPELSGSAKRNWYSASSTSGLLAISSTPLAERLPM